MSWKPQAKKAIVIAMKPGCLAAAIKDSRMFDPGWSASVLTSAGFGPISTPRIAMTSATSTKAIAPVRQPLFAMRYCPSGAISSVASEPAAETMPSVCTRRSAGTTRATAPKRTPKPVPAMPMPTISPAPALRPRTG